jgi:hypothetical protein
MARRSTRSGSRFGANFKTAFAFGLGTFSALIVFAAIAIPLIVGGYIMINREQKKPKEEQSQGALTTGYVLMGVGVVIGGGIGLNSFLGEIGESL